MYLPIEFNGFSRLIKLIINSSNTENELNLMWVFLETFPVDFNRSDWLIEFIVDFRELQLRFNNALILQGALELFLRFSVQTQL